VAVLTELMDTAFSASATPEARREAVRELCFQLKTKWREAKPSPPAGEEDAIFPLTLLAKTGRGYLVQIARQMNGSYVQGWYDACAVMMRRLVEALADRRCGSGSRSSPLTRPYIKTFQASNVNSILISGPPRGSACHEIRRSSQFVRMAILDRHDGHCPSCGTSRASRSRIRSKS